MQPHRLRLWIVLILVSCVEVPEPDLFGPRVVAATFIARRTVEVPVGSTLEVHFSESIDPASVHRGSVALVPWESVGSCELSPICDEGSCERGKCQVDALSETELRRFDRGEGTVGERVKLELLDSARGVHSILRVVPERPLRPHNRYTWLVAAAVRDPQGSPLSDSAGLASRWRRDFVTAREGSSGPEARLHRPPRGARGVPINIATVETTFELPVKAAPRSILFLEAERGGTVELVEPRPCEGWVPGLCLQWSVATPLAPHERYRPSGGTLKDRWGRGAVVPRDRSWFQTSSSADHEPPDSAALVTRRLGPCFEVAYQGIERVVLELRLQGRTVRASGSRPRVALRVLEANRPEEVAARIAIIDLADNETMGEHDVSVPQAGHGPEPVAITEILADAPGPEPHQEFVEVSVLEDRSDPVEDLWLTDRSWPEVVDALAAGEDPPGDGLPPLDLKAGNVFVIIGPGYVQSPKQPGQWIRLESSLGESGLKNAGEPVVLYGANPPRLVSSYGNHVDTARDHEGRSVVRADPWACDVPEAWRSHPTGTSNPGTLP